jgi:hypothetical protein
LGEEVVHVVIPRVSLGLENYALVITSQRIAFLKTGIDYTQVAAALGFFLTPGDVSGAGAVLGSKIAEYFFDDSINFKGKLLSSMIGEDIANTEFPLNRITEIKLCIERDKYKIKVIGYTKDNTVTELINGDLVPLVSDIKANKKAGYKLHEICTAYANQTQKQIERWLGYKLTQRFF